MLAVEVDTLQGFYGCSGGPGAGVDQAPGSGLEPAPADFDDFDQHARNIKLESSYEPYLHTMESQNNQSEETAENGGRADQLGRLASQEYKLAPPHEVQTMYYTNELVPGMETRNIGACQQRMARSNDNYFQMNQMSRSYPMMNGGAQIHPANHLLADAAFSQCSTSHYTNSHPNNRPPVPPSYTPPSINGAQQGSALSQGSLQAMRRTASAPHKSTTVNSSLSRGSSEGYQLPVSDEILKRLFHRALHGLPGYLHTKSESTKSRMLSTTQYSEALLSVFRGIRDVQRTRRSALPTDRTLRHLRCFVQSIIETPMPSNNTPSAMENAIEKYKGDAEANPEVAKAWASLAGPLAECKIYMQWPENKKNRNHFPKYNKVSVPHVRHALELVWKNEDLTLTIMESLAKVPQMGTWPLLDFFSQMHNTDPKHLLTKLFQWFAGILVYTNSMHALKDCKTEPTFGTPDDQSKDGENDDDDADSADSSSRSSTSDKRLRDPDVEAERDTRSKHLRSEY
ncbi:Hypothetical Protein FCC1311_056632 [Hondaea fermentalgiana]|uniref:Uncharacterized protein n=1 Tax=Hondaea fermentalgiana TaxID=2315210 RepID=A0A2R5GET3_9STRA|nr:Hypothetical Protein FCC1311_056632 [Hondaea fermentalgiana]|eukprot:GBG29442.1 Hypothetical Protein FCC1311_056632 [Hondaea fermentalgiana]